MTDGGLLRRAADRAAAQPFYLASSLLAYARAERLDDDALAAQLGCEVAQLPALLLCRRPTGEGPMFRQDVEAIARRFGISAPRLAQLVRAADAVAALQRATAQPSGQLLAAARDRLDSEGQQDGIDGDGQPPHADDGDDAP